MVAQATVTVFCEINFRTSATQRHIPVRAPDDAANRSAMFPSMKSVGQLGRPQQSDIPGLVEAFWRAAAAMSGSDRYRHLTAPSTAAAEALLHLASIDAEPALRAILRPDLDVDVDDDAVTWTVACFEIGCVAPAGVHQVGSACDALASLVSCQYRTHVASELICSGPNGLQWVAVVRADRRFSFQFPDLGNVSAPHPTAATLAVTRWRRHLSYREACLFVDELPADDDEAESDPVAASASGTDVLDLSVEGAPVERTPVEDQAGTPDTAAHAEDGLATDSAEQRTNPDRLPSGPELVTSESSRLAELNARREEARRSLRKTVATHTSDPSRSLDAALVGADAITNQTLAAAMRSAIAEVVPFLERYLLSAVGSAVASAMTPDHQAGSAELTELVGSLPAQLDAVLRNDRRERAQLQDVDELSDALVAAIRDEMQEALQDIDTVQRERLRRLTDLTTALNDRQSELRTWMTSIRQVEDVAERRFDRLEHHLQLVEQRVEDSTEQARRLDRVVEDVSQLRSAIDEVSLILREIQSDLTG